MDTGCEPQGVLYTIILVVGWVLAAIAAINAVGMSVVVYRWRRVRKQMREAVLEFGDHVEVSYDGARWCPAVYIRKVDGELPHEVFLKCPWSGKGDEHWVKLCRKADW